MDPVSSFRQPQYLTGADVPEHRVRCPIHGFIRFSENERKIIDHPIFRRLRDIRQLALTEFVYPGANHTRFEHSLGVMELATRAFDHLASLRGDRLESTFRRVAELSDRPLAIARQLVRLAALLHDIGHVSFSHAAETVLHQDRGHEAFTVLLVEERPFLGAELDRLYFSGFANLLARLLKGGSAMPPQLKILKDLVSGEMDADRSDYLLRDSYHCGVEYGRFDQRRMIQCLDLHLGDGGSLEIGLQRDGIHTFEALILARYQMNTQVYFHRIRRIYDHYLRQYFEAVDPTQFDSHDKLLELTDTVALAAIFRDAKSPDTPRGKWAVRIRERRHHRLVHETGEDAGAMDLKHAEQLLVRLQEKFGGIDFVHDVARSSIHKLLLPEDPDLSGLVALPLIERSGQPDYVGARSHILRRVPKRFQVARVFADVDRDNIDLLRVIRAFAQEEYRKLGGQS